MEVNEGIVSTPALKFPYLCTITIDDKSLKDYSPHALFNSLTKANLSCADCPSLEPDWCSINLGIILCKSCATHHRALGASVSKVRSILLDNLDPATQSLLLNIGNNLVNDIFQANQPLLDIVETSSTSSSSGEDFTRLKYDMRAFVSKSLIAQYASTPESMAQSAFWAITFNDLPTLIKLNATRGVDLSLLFDCPVHVTAATPSQIPDGQTALIRLYDSTSLMLAEFTTDTNDPNNHLDNNQVTTLIPKHSLTTLLHYAIIHGNVCILEYLILNSPNLRIKDGLGRRPLDLAKMINFKHSQNRLSKFL